MSARSKLFRNFYAHSFLAVLFAICGCNAANRVGNSGAATSDLKALLNKSGAAVGDLNCNMIGSSRSFNCEATLTDTELAALESALKLTDSSPRAYYTKAACQPKTMSKGALIRRGTKLRQPEFGGFEYLEIVLDPAAHKACFESAYSSG